MLHFVHLLFHLGWKARVVDDSGLMQDVTEYAPRLVPMFEVFSMIERTDAWRYLVVHWKGGVYLDSDVECMMPFENWFETWISEDVQPLQAIVGIEVLQSNQHDHWQPVQFCQ